MIKNIRITVAVGAVALVLSLVVPNAAVAATATGPIAVSASVTDSCSVSATAIAFGAYIYTAPSTANSTMTVTCTNGSVVSSIALDNGLNPSGATPPGRQLKAGGAAVIGYALYSDSGLTTPWTTVGPASSAYTAGASPSTFTVYGRAPAGPNVIAGTYTDTVGITVNYV